MMSPLWYWDAGTAPATRPRTIFISCVGKSLGQGQSDIDVIPEKVFVDSMYPYFETSTAPMDVKNLNKLVKIPAIAAKFNDFNLRYFRLDRRRHRKNGFIGFRVLCGRPRRRRLFRVCLLERRSQL